MSLTSGFGIEVANQRFTLDYTLLNELRRATNILSKGSSTVLEEAAACFNRQKWAEVDRTHPMRTTEGPAVKVVQAP